MSGGADLRAIYFTRFRPDPDGGGGARRAAQVAELLGPWGGTVRSAMRLNGISSREAKALRSRWRRRWQRWASRLAGDWSFAHRPYAARLGRVDRAWAAGLAKEAAPDILLVDEPVYFPRLVETALGRKVPVVGVCHNLESSVRPQVTPRGGPRLQVREFGLYARCALALTIAEEDAWRLETEGARALYFPYFPAAEVAGRLAAVRMARQGTPKRGLLLLGSAVNKATCRGMAAAARAWSGAGASTGGEPLLVAGFGTDKRLKELKGLPGVEFHGELSDASVDRLLSTVRASLCHQEEGGGALTRIVEFLLAGVPVLASRSAARSYHGAAGLQEYGALEEVPALNASLATGQPDFPAPLAPDPAPVKAALTALAGR